MQTKAYGEVVGVNNVGRTVYDKAVEYKRSIASSQNNRIEVIYISPHMTFTRLNNLGSKLNIG